MANIKGSIGRSQAEALAEGFLDDIGSDQDFQPANVLGVLLEITGEMLEDMQQNLVRSNSVASGNLSKSIFAHEPEAAGTAIKVDVEMNFYGPFINKGVKGTRGGSGPFAFKNEKVSAKMLAAIMASLKSATAKSTNVKKGRSVSRHEQKNSTAAKESLAYAVARSIKQKGIKKTGFIDKAIISAQKRVDTRLGVAFKADIIALIEKGLPKISPDKK